MRTDSAAYLCDHDANRVAAAIGSRSVGYTYDRAGQLVSRVDRAGLCQVQRNIDTRGRRAALPKLRRSA